MLDDTCQVWESMWNIPLLPSSALAKLSLIITVNNLTPSPAHPGKVSDWAETKCEEVKIY